MQRFLCFNFFIFLLIFHCSSIHTHAQTSESQCYITNGVHVCHNPADESVFYNTPSDQVAYNVQTLKLADKYVTIYHGEPYGKPVGSSGDSIKSALSIYPYTYSMPTNNYVIHGLTSDFASVLYSDTGSIYTSMGGAANPVTVAGRYWAGDQYYYTFFIGVIDDDGDRVAGENDYRHHLYIARTLDFQKYDIKTGESNWIPFSRSYCDEHVGQCRPATQKDSDGNLIVGSKPNQPDLLQGLFGSIVILNQKYYYFYNDFDPGTNNYYLFYRTNLDLNQSWSPPTKIISTPFMEGAMVRIAKAQNMDRWVMLYHCKNAIGALDLCLQYTENLNIIGPGGLSSLQINSNGNADGYNLGLRGSGEQYDSFGQPYWMTDKDGNLTSPDTEVGQPRGGEIRWLDYVENGQIKVWGGKVWRAGWNIIEVDPPPTPTFQPLPNDFDTDGDIDFLDLITLLLKPILVTPIFDHNLLVRSF